MTSTPVSVDQRTCLYVFGLVDADASVPAPLSMVRLGRVAAVHRSVACDDLAADVSDDATLADLARLHDDVLCRLVAAGPVLPMRLGTTFADGASLGVVLGRAHDEVAAELDRLRGRHEFRVRVRTTAPPRTPAERSQPRSGTDYLLSRRDAHRGAPAPSAASRLQALDESLLGLAEEATEPATDAGDATAVRSYLVAEGRQEEFLAQLDAAAEPGVVVAVSGPLPAYSFVRVRMEAPS